MKWNDIKNMTLDLFYVDKLSDQEEQEYSDKFQRLANQGLISIANSVKPKIGTYVCRVYDKAYTVTRNKDLPIFVVTKTTDIDSLDKIETNEGAFYCNGELVYSDGTKIYTTAEADIVIMANDMLVVAGDTKYGTHDFIIYSDNDERFEQENLFAIGEPVIMPDDFISFGNMVGRRKYVKIDPYYNTRETYEENYVPSHYVKRDGICFEKDGVYTVYYNSLWEEITDDYTKYPYNGTVDLPQDRSVLSILPQYIAFNILAQDDIQRSTIIKNDYETLLARLDTSTEYDLENYESTRGWY